MAELRPYNPTLRERTKQYVAGALTNLGMDNYMAQKTARGFTGSTRPDLNMAEASGVLEFTPVGLAFGLDESARGLKTAQTPLDYAIEGTIGAVTLGESVAKAYPFTQQTIKFLRSLKSKNKSIADEIVDEQKRKTLKTMGKGALATVAAEPLIGALGNVPKSTVAKKVIKELPKSKFELPALINQLNNFKKLSTKENIDSYTVPDIKEMFDEAEISKDELKELGIDPDNFTREDLTNDKVIENFINNESFNPDAFLNEQDLLDEIRPEISDYLSGKKQLNDLDKSEEGAFNLIKSLTEDYNLDKDGISKYLNIPIGKITKGKFDPLEIPEFGGGRMGNKQFIGNIEDSSQIDLAIEQFKKDNPQFANNKFSVIDTDIDGKKLPQAQVWIDDMPPEDLTE